MSDDDGLLNLRCAKCKQSLETVIIDLTKFKRSVAAILAWYPARRKSAWYTLMRFRLIKNGVAHAYDVYIV